MLPSALSQGLHENPLLRGEQFTLLSWPHLQQTPRRIRCLRHAGGLCPTSTHGVEACRKAAQNLTDSGAIICCRHQPCSGHAQGTAIVVLSMLLEHHKER